MNKRDLLVGAAAAGLASAAWAASPGRSPRALPALLTVSCAVGRTNRGPFDPVRDQMMGKHGIAFSRAWVFDAPALRRLPACTIAPTVEYDGKKHVLSGPLLADVLAAAGVNAGSGIQLDLRAVDGYAAPVALAEALQWRMIVALDMDGSPLELGGLGPQWAVYEADTLAAFRDKPLNERFAPCPWGLYSIEVRRG